MNFEQNEEINVKIHEFMGKCWHEWRSMGPDWGYRCGRCGDTGRSSRNTDYCSPVVGHSLVLSVMQKALEKFGEDALADAIGVATIGVPCAVEKDLLLATPEQKMRAVVSLMGRNDD